MRILDKCIFTILPTQCEAIFNTMIKYIIAILATTWTFTAISQTADTSHQLREILDTQRKAWNDGDIEKFMEAYWKNDSLVYIGKNGVTYGYQNTLRKYKTNYPTRDKMGVLQFTIIQLRPLSPGYYYMIGKWHLDRKDGNAEGNFTLLFKEIDGKWVIVADHSS
ncbi:DUF4440 domain-containing protein [soil metagenome]